MTILNWKCSRTECQCNSPKAGEMSIQWEITNRDAEEVRSQWGRDCGGDVSTVHYDGPPWRGQRILTTNEDKTLQEIFYQITLNFKIG